MRETTYILDLSDDSRWQLQEHDGDSYHIVASGRYRHDDPHPDNYNIDLAWNWIDAAIMDTLGYLPMYEIKEA